MCDDSDFGGSSDYGSSSDSGYSGGYGGGGGASASFRESYSEPETIREARLEINEASDRLSQVHTHMDSFVAQAQAQFDQDDVEADFEPEFDGIVDEAVEEGIGGFDISDIDFDGDFQDILEQFTDVSIDELLNIIEVILEMDVMDENYFMQTRIRAKRVGNSVIFRHKNFPCIIEVDPMTGEYTITAELCDTDRFLGGIEDSEQVDIKYVANLLELLKLNSRIAPCAISIIDDGDDDLTNDAVVMSLTQIITDGLKFDLQLAMNTFCSSLVIVQETLFADQADTESEE